MESETELTESNLNSVKELLLDEDKTVTYISLSKDLCLHVNISKILLHRVIQNIRKDKRNNFELKVNYLISGLSKSNEARITVCSESELEELKSTFKIIYFEHIYSISKGSNTNSLMINNYNDFSLCSGSIKNRDCVKHSSSEINNFKCSSLKVSDVALNKPITPIKKVKAEGIEKTTNNKNGFHQETNISAIDTETKIKKEEVSPKKENNTKQNSQKVNGNKTQKGIAGFFNKPSTQNKTSQNNAEKLSTTEKLKNGSENTKLTDIKVETMEVDESNSKSKSENKSKSKSENKSKSKNIDLKCEQPIKTEHKENNNSNSNGKNKTLNKIKKSSKVDKKRKRVLHVSDSESEVESDHEKEIDSIPPESDDEIPPTPMANNIKITSGLVNPKKKRKVIDKTYEDDGFILTKKVEIYESCSEDETMLDVVPEPKIKEVKKEISPTNNIKQNKTKKNMSSPQKGKQATLMNFFKKK